MRHDQAGAGAASGDKGELAILQSWALGVFCNFFHDKNDIFGIFYQVNLTGGRLFKQEIGYRLVFLNRNRL